MVSKNPRLIAPKVVCWKVWFFATSSSWRNSYGTPRMGGGAIPAVLMIRNVTGHRAWIPRIIMMSCIFKMYINLYTKYIYICVYIIDYTGIVATHVLFLLRYNICHGQKNSHLPSCCALSSHTFAGLTGPTISTSSGPGRNCATGGHLLGIMGMVWDDASTLHM